MNPRRTSCSREDARKRLEDARRFLAAAELLEEPGNERDTANDLRRALDRKQRAGYHSEDVTDRNAGACITLAGRLHARALLLFQGPAKR